MKWQKLSFEFQVIHVIHSTVKPNKPLQIKFEDILWLHGDNLEEKPDRTFICCFYSPGLCGLNKQEAKS